MNGGIIAPRENQIWSKRRVPGTCGVKRKTSLFSVHGKICSVLIHGFCSFVLRNLCLIYEANAENVENCILGNKFRKECRKHRAEDVA